MLTRLQFLFSRRQDLLIFVKKKKRKNLYLFHKKEKIIYLRLFLNVTNLKAKLYQGFEWIMTFFPWSFNGTVSFTMP